MAALLCNIPWDPIRKDILTPAAFTKINLSIDVDTKVGEEKRYSIASYKETQRKYNIAHMGNILKVCEALVFVIDGFHRIYVIGCIAALLQNTGKSQ